MKIQHDNRIWVSGGGLVGAICALFLAQRGFAVRLFEKQSLAALCTPSQRSVIINHRTAQSLAQQGLWKDLSPKALGIAEMRASLQGHFGSLIYTAAQEKLPFLGYAFSVPVLLEILHQKLAQAGVECLYEQALIPGEYTGSAALIIAADGSDAWARFWQIPCEEEATDQVAFVSTLSVDHHKNIAYERFSAKGTVALLPFQGSRQMTMVWSGPEALLEQYLGALSMDQRLAHLQGIMGDRCGKIHDSTPWMRIPLPIRLARWQTVPQGLLLGNSAHLLHPIAAQGLNLSLRDVCSLVSVLDQAYQSGQDIGRRSVLQNYVRASVPDQDSILGHTRSVLYGMTNHHIPSAWRALALTAMGLCSLCHTHTGRLSLGSPLISKSL